ncbi:hypothetical protein [Nocardioides sp. SYSU DS0651]|uniref:hypothetical protein n=1 Tax=Nocardioides sp. SYSU DS0651 TaxID=3415955 RepID=UPI003F4BEAAC
MKTAERLDARVCDHEGVLPGGHLPSDEVVRDIARSERALDALLARAQRVHRSDLQHEPTTCLVCFMGA